jgi:hypothetical protein
VFGLTGTERGTSQDTEPPIVSFSSEADLPDAVSQSSFATFAFTGQDQSGILYWCKISSDSANDLQDSVSAYVQNATVADTPVGFGVWQACVSPITYHWLLPGEA